MAGHNPFSIAASKSNLKRRKLQIIEFDSEDDDIKLIDIENGYDTTSTNATTSSVTGINNDNKAPTAATKAKPTKTKAKKKYSKIQKLSSLGKSVTKYGTDLNKIRAELHALVNDKLKCDIIINKIKKEYTRRAQGADIIYAPVKTAAGKTVYKKKPFLANIKWAQKVPPGGGANTGFNDVELCILIIGAFQLVNCYAAELKCDKRLAPHSSGNVGKIALCYIHIILALDYHNKYPAEIWQRNKTAFAKRTKLLCNKKRTDLESLTTGSIFSAWGKPEDVQQTS